LTDARAQLEFEETVLRRRSCDNELGVEFLNKRITHVDPMANTNSEKYYRSFQVWDAPTRLDQRRSCFRSHRRGLGLLYDDALGLSAPGKVLLKQVHVSIGYVLTLNFIWRFVWAFLGNRYARWSAILPFGTGYWGKLRGYVHAFLTGEPQHYVGHNPAARIGIALLLLLILVQVVTGLILAGTDLFWPPFGGRFASWVAAIGIDPATVSSLASNTIDQTAYQAMRAFRRPIVPIHLYAFYALAVMIVLHLIAVVLTELHEGGNTVSAMFTGTKLLNRTPEDKRETSENGDLDK
jgi:cytochrome b